MTARLKSARPVSRAHMKLRNANVPECARVIGAELTKNELLEIAWNLATQANAAGSADDEPSTFERLASEAEIIGAKISKVKLKQLRESFGVYIPADEVIDVTDES